MNQSKPDHHLPARSDIYIRPLRLSLLIGLCYFIYSFAYLIYSTNSAPAILSDVTQLTRVGRIPGFSFNLFTAIGLIVVSYALFRRARDREAQAMRELDALLQADRRSMAGLHAASVAHDMRNLLMVVDYGVTRLAQPVGSNSELDETAHNTSESVQLIKRLAERLMSVDKLGIPGAAQPCDLAELTHEVVKLARSHRSVKACRVTCQTPERLPATLNPVMFEQMLLNLMINAGEAMEGCGPIDVRLGDDHGQAFLQVGDGGTGISSELERQIFQPLFTTKRDGSGLGLVSVKAFVEMQSGVIQIGRSPLGGACFGIEFTGLSPATQQSFPQTQTRAA